MTPPRHDPLLLRRGFERHGPDPASPPFLVQEIGTRLLSRLDYVKLTPPRMLDLGAGCGWMGPLLQRRFPQANLVETDLSLALLPRPAPRSWWAGWSGKPRRDPVVADADALPFPAKSFSLIWAHLLLPWGNPDTIFAEASRLLAPGGLFIFSTLGLDTLKELRHALLTLPGGTQRLGAFSDMHDLGDALVHHGLAEPVMEREDLHIDYPSVELLLRDLRAAGPGNTLPDRPRGLVGRQAWQTMLSRYEELRQPAGLPATFEVIYGQAWKPLPRTLPDGRAVIDIHTAH